VEMPNDMSVNTSADPQRVKRRTLVHGAAWTIPVIAVTAATPSSAASGSYVLTAALAGLTACGTAPLQLTLKDAEGAAASGPVLVTLPAGLAWADDNTTAPRTVNVSGGSASVLVKSTGAGGTFTITAQGQTPTTTSQVSVSVTVVAAGGRIYYYDRSLNPELRNIDPNNVVPNDPTSVHMMNGGNQVLALTAGGEVWINIAPRSTVSYANWSTLNVPALAAVFHPTILGGQAYGVTPSGDVYYIHVVSNAYTATLVPGASGITHVFQDSSKFYGLGADGSFWESSTAFGALGFSPVMMAAAPSVPLAGVTKILDENNYTTGRIAVIANGKIYSISAGNPVARELTGPTNPKSFSMNGFDLYVVDGDGSLWTASVNSSTAVQAMTKQTNAPSLDRLLGNFRAGVLAQASDGTLRYISSITPSSYIDVTPTAAQFAPSDVVQYVGYNYTGSSGQIAARLANGDVWYTTIGTNNWAKLTTPSPAQDIDGNTGAQVALLLSGDTACS
jgi:hypothetical protein